MARPLSNDFTGKRVGRLVVIDRAGSRGGHPTWNCVCDCGNRCVRILNRGHTHSCGCLVADNNRAIRVTHGKRQTRVYRIWCGMKNRCYNEKQINYERYGGRGITVCLKWRKSFAAFYADMGDPPSDEHSIDRINNNGPYKPDNCRWATAAEQKLNKRPRKWRRRPAD